MRNTKQKTGVSTVKGKNVLLMLRSLPHDITDIIYQYWSVVKVVKEWNRQKFRVIVMFHYSIIHNDQIKEHLPVLFHQINHVALLAKIRYLIITK